MPLAPQSPPSVVAGSTAQSLASAVAAALKWIIPHGIGRWGSRRLPAAYAAEQQERLSRLYGRLIPPDSLVFDLGANLGNRIAALLQCGATVVAVEPQPDCVSHLLQTWGRRITVVQAAVGAAAGRLTLRLGPPFDTSASLSPEFVAKAEASGRLGQRAWQRTLDVEVITLDSLIACYGTPAFIKIDVEGFEWEVLRGLSTAVPALSFEWTSNLPQSALRCIDRLVELGLPYFHFSFGESLLLAHATSLEVKEARRLIELLGEDERLYGDIYASRRPITRS